MIWIVLKGLAATTGARIALGVLAGIVALKAYGMSQEHRGAAKERERARIAGDANVKTADKARATVRPTAKPDDVCVRDAACRD